MRTPNPLPTPESDAIAGPLDWGAKLAEHESWLRRVVAARVGEPQAVDEVMQNVAVAALAQRSPLVNPTRAAVWLYRLAVRHVLLYRRKTGRQRSLVDRYAARTNHTDVDLAPSPVAWLVSRERRQLVQDALRRLPPRDAELLILKYAEGFAARELAERMGATITTIEARLHRARHRLRAELAGLAADLEVTEHDHA
jgi:RNA polymerase sigma-70 factor (ECF subfamily)